MDYYGAILRKYSGIKKHQFRLQDDGEGVYIAQWDYTKANKPTLTALAKVCQEMQREGLIIKIKEEAKQRIHEVAQDWKQRNMLARSYEILLNGGAATAEEQAELDLYNTKWARINAIRSYSDYLESLALDPNTDIDTINWDGFE